MVQKAFYCLLLFLPGLLKGYSQQSAGKPVFVIVHGAWGGSWAFKKVDSLLTEKGAIVYRPSMTGLGERIHLADTNISLKTHINDIVNMLVFEDLHNIILLGHSYGGMVVTGVADSLPGRIKKIIYLDAFVPSDGESLVSISGSGGEWIKNIEKNGFLVPPWVTPGTKLPHDVPHPLKTFTDVLRLKGRAKNTPSIYILTVDPGKEAENDDFYNQSERARKKGWKVLELKADHNPQWSAPEAFVEMLYQLR